MYSHSQYLYQGSLVSPNLLLSVHVSIRGSQKIFFYTVSALDPVLCCRPFFMHEFISFQSGRKVSSSIYFRHLPSASNTSRTEHYHLSRAAASGSSKELTALLTVFANTNGSGADSEFASSIINVIGGNTLDD